MTTPTAHPRRVLLLGATGTIGRATLRALVRRGHDVVCFVRPFTPAAAAPAAAAPAAPAAASARAAATAQGAGAAAGDDHAWFSGCTLRFGQVTDPVSVAVEGFRGERFDALVSCLASRNGVPKDAWEVDYLAHVNALAAARNAGVTHVVQLSAICVQKPRLAFQRAKLAFEKLLIESGLDYTIVRPTAFFKSLSGQVERVKAGKPFLVFGDGRRTSCKPISDADLADYIADCLEDESRRNRVLPIGGPGGAITPRRQGEELFALLNRPPLFRQVPVALLDGIIGVLGALGHLAPPLADKAELARIGRYYATESMLVFDPETGRYDADRTPSTGTETLFDFYAKLLNGAPAPDRGDHAIF